MKILIAVHHFPPTFRGGAEWRAYRTAMALQRAGHQVQVVCVDSITHGDGRMLECTRTAENGLRVHRLSFNLARSLDPFLWSYRNPVIWRYVVETIGAFEPDVFHLIGGYLITGSGIEAAQQAGVPAVLTLTDFWFLCPRITLLRSDGSRCDTPGEPLQCALCLRKEKRRYRLPDRATRGAVGRMFMWVWRKNGDPLAAALQQRRSYLLSLFNGIDAVISPSLFLKDLFTAHGGSPRRFVHMRQGLDMDGWGSVGRRKDDLYLRIGYIGQIAEHKGVDVLVEAFTKLRSGRKKPQLFIYGDLGQFPRFSQRLRRRAAGRDDILFAGRFDRSQVRRVYAGLDVLVVPSVWNENSPNVILEAFATDTPVVVSDLGGMAELVTDGVNGFRVEAGSVKALAQVLQRFVDQPDLVERLGRGAPSVKTTREEIEELVQLYRSLEVG